MTPKSLADKKIFITGATGLVARPVAEQLAAANEVWCSSRFTQPEDREHFEAKGIRTFAWDIETGDLTGLPDDFTHVLHAGTVRDERDTSALIEAVSRSIGLLMHHCRGAEAFLYLSSAVVYQHLDPAHLHTESDPLGVNTRSKWGPSYGLSKISGEAVARAGAQALGLPTTIARLNVAYSPYPPHGGLPARLFERALEGLPILLPPAGDSYCSPLHVDDITRQIPLLWQVASIPATIVNWGGDQVVSVRAMLDHLSTVTGVKPTFAIDDSSSTLMAFDATKRRQLIGPCQVGWEEGISSAITTRYRDRLPN
jgi:nucleoside-diphosphate-sugar epimerase